MSGIYIPGMEMPKSCDVCRFAIDGFCYASGKVNVSAVEERQVTNYCPLIPVPDHGRLIDADALDDILADQSEDAYNRTHAPRSWGKALSAMRDYLDNAPTIIPAYPPVMYYPQVPGITPTVISDKEGEG